MVQLNLTISLPLRVVCVQCGQDLALEELGPSPGICNVKCPGCGVRIRLIQGPAPAAPKPIDRRMPPFRPKPKT